MSNGGRGIGGFTVPQAEGKVEVHVEEWWTSADDGTTLRMKVPDRDAYQLDMDKDETRQLAALLLAAAGNTDLATAIPEAIAQIQARERAREDAYTALREASRAAEEAFVDATGPQQEQFKAAMAKAEQDYAAATGEEMRTSRSVNLDRDAADCPF